MIRLSVTDGSISQTLSLSSDKVFIGRLSGNTLRLSHPSVSRKHCLIRRTSSGGLELLDLSSRHGTWRNGERVERTPLVVGDELQVGEARIRIEALEGIVVPPPPPEQKGLFSRIARGAEKKGPVLAAFPSGEAAPKAHGTSFSQELYRHAQRTPWWAASLSLHVFLVWLLFSLPYATPRGEQGMGVIEGKLVVPFSGVRFDRPQTESVVPTEKGGPDPKPVDQLPVPEDLPRLTPPPIMPKEVHLAIPDVGPFDVPFSRLPGSGLTASKPILANRDFGQAGASEVNAAVGKLLRKSLTGRPGEVEGGLLHHLTARQVLVVKGHYDEMEAILDLLSIKRTEVSVRHLEHTDLTDRKVLLINCSNERPSHATVLRIREFVRNGGYLLTTDWGVVNVLAQGFPGYVEPLMKHRRNVITPNEVIHVFAAPDERDSFLLDGMFLEKGEAKWWLEESSYPFVVKRPSAVDILVESTDLDREYGVKPVVATFRYGKGRVLHVLGHLFQKEGNLKGAFSAQRLIVNFLFAAIRKR